MMRAIIVDDEPLARKRLRAMLALHADVDIVAECEDAVAAVEAVREHRPSLLFLDVQMPGASGFSVLEEATVTPSPFVVFVTAHAQHALKAFDLDVVDYLTKPVRRERLHAALQRVGQRIASAPIAVSAPAEDQPVIVVSDRGRVVRVPLHEVLYLKAELKYVTLRTADRSHVLDESLSDLQERLGERFLRVHRNALVARTAVRALQRRVMPGEGDEEGGESWAVCIAPVDEWLAVSRRQVAAVREALVAAGR